ncbi:hypothetical protein D8Y22_05390 [Salinadaptatus halalkaliphilus]|uniref:Adenine deaminase n=1 Tax=Salinadaptatus halalkaliphilus TaxID=2419781 RepID=A0A4S3TRH1_9EURY|nr:hypothetical protein [Salinadaptatus halalkaliphilus]THE65953.1 hypothetical protein D8Y22_05390 [Salinadaptatus halalkaliphilus]
MNELQGIALEREGATADLVVDGGHVYCSNRREFLERDVAIVGDRIAALLPDAGSVVGDETTVVAADDQLVLPGLIDAHTHADLQVTPDRLYPKLLEAGTTAIVSETSGLGLLCGSRGIEMLLERTADTPVATYLALAPQGQTVQTLTFPGVPALKLTASGYADVLDRSVVSLELDGGEREPGGN